MNKDESTIPPSGFRVSWAGQQKEIFLQRADEQQTPPTGNDGKLLLNSECQSLSLYSTRLCWGRQHNRFRVGNTSNLCHLNII